MDPATRYHSVDFISSVAMRYHAKRRSFFEFVSKAGTALSLALGTASVASLFAAAPDVAKYASAAIAVVSGLNLAFGTADAGRKHGELFRRWADLRAEIVKVDPNDPVAVSDLEVKRAKIDGESPGQLEALSVISENEEKEVRQRGTLYRVGWLQRALAQLFTLPGWQPKEDRVLG